MVWGGGDWSTAWQVSVDFDQRATIAKPVNVGRGRRERALWRLVVYSRVVRHSRNEGRDDSASSSGDWGVVVVVMVVVVEYRNGEGGKKGFWKARGVRGRGRWLASPVSRLSAWQPACLPLLSACAAAVATRPNPDPHARRVRRARTRAPATPANPSPTPRPPHRPYFSTPPHPQTHSSIHPIRWIHRYSLSLSLSLSPLRVSLRSALSRTETFYLFAVPIPYSYPTLILLVLDERTPCSSILLDQCSKARHFVHGSRNFSLGIHWGEWIHRERAMVRQMQMNRDSRL